MPPRDYFLDRSARPVVAHRGASGLRPENTLAAFALARELGADGIELDVRLSHDGIPVVHHDPDLLRSSRRPELVRDLVAAELARCDAGDGEGIPALATVLEATGDLPLLVELKEPEAALPVLEVFRHGGAEPRVVVASFHREALTPFHTTGIPLGAARTEIARASLAAAVGWPAGCVPWQFYAVPDRYRELVPVPTGRFIRRAGRQGCPVHVWTVDDPARANVLWQLGVSGIITNRPDLILAARNGLRP